MRFSWNCWPATRLEATRIVVPVGAMYTPLKRIQGMQTVEYEPVACKHCSAILNPYVQIDL